MLKKILKIVGGIVAGLVLVAVSLFGLAQLGVDMSPMFYFLTSSQDKSTRPSPPGTATGQIGTANVTINYGRPAKSNREIFGNVVPYNEVWRTGANEATTITLEGNFLVAGKPLKAGQYQLFTIPRPDRWTIIFNSKAKQWGAFFHDEKSDVLRVDVPTGSSDEMLERLTISIENAPETGFTIAWDKTKVFVPLTAQ